MKQIRDYSMQKTFMELKLKRNNPLDIFKDDFLVLNE